MRRAFVALSAVFALGAEIRAGKCTFISSFQLAFLVPRPKVLVSDLKPTSHLIESNTTSLKAQFFSGYNSSRVQISYGPFTAPSSTQNNGMKDFQIGNITKPCSNCLITFMEVSALIQAYDSSVETHALPRRLDCSTRTEHMRTVTQACGCTTQYYTIEIVVMPFVPSSLTDFLRLETKGLPSTYA